MTNLIEQLRNNTQYQKILLKCSMHFRFMFDIKQILFFILLLVFNINMVSVEYFGTPLIRTITKNAI